MDGYEKNFDMSPRTSAWGTMIPYLGCTKKVEALEFEIHYRNVCRYHKLKRGHNLNITTPIRLLLLKPT